MCIHLLTKIDVLREAQQHNDGQQNLRNNAGNKLQWGVVVMLHNRLYLQHNHYAY